jgi:hypothetical protein
MSLINDALKRARQAHTANPGPAPAPGAPMQPAAPPQPLAPPAYFLPFMLCIFCAACWLIIKSWDHQQKIGKPDDAVDALTVMARESGPGPDAAMPIPENRNFELESWSGEPAPAAAPVATAAPEPAPAPAPPAPNPPPAASAYKLQGIFYRVTKPSAVINTKSVFVGDVVASATVKAIERDRVTLELDGRPLVLTLE